MKIIGYNESDKALTNINDREIPKRDFLCPMHLKLGLRVIMHPTNRNGTKFFRYNPNQKLDEGLVNDFKAKHGGESLTHLKIKRHVLDKLSKNDDITKACNEHIIKIDGRYRQADVYVEKGDVKEVYEVQLSSITEDDLHQRTTDYLNAGIDSVFWLLHTAKSFNERLNFIHNHFGFPVFGIELQKKNSKTIWSKLTL